MTTVTINDDLAARLRAVSGQEQGLNQFVEAALDEAVRRKEREAAGRAERLALLDGPRRPFDPEATYQRYREMYGWSEDLSKLSAEEIEEQGDAILAALSPEKIAEAERLGLL